MTVKVRLLGSVLLMLGLVPLTGCFTIVTRAYYELRGAKGTIRFIEEPPSGTLDPFRSVQFEPATTDVGPRICPPELLAAYDRSARQWTGQLRERFPGGEPTLTISSDLLFFNKKGLFGDAQLLARLRLRDRDRVLGDAVVVTGSKAFREGDADALAEASIKTIAKYLVEGSVPEEEKETRHREK